MWGIFLILAIILLLLLAFLFGFLKYKHNYWQFLEIPHEKPKALTAVLGDLLIYAKLDDDVKRQHYQQLYTSFKLTGAPFCGFHRLLQPMALVLDRELVKQILIKDFANFNDRGMYHNSKHDPLSSDLYSLRADEWKEMRQKLEPLFRSALVGALHDNCFNVESQAHLLNAFDVALLMHRNMRTCFIDVQPLIRRYVLACIARSVFGLDVSLQVSHPLNEFDAMTQKALSEKRHGKFINLLLQKYPSFGQKLGFSYTERQAEAYFMKLIACVVSERKKNPLPRGTKDYLQLIIDIESQELSTHIAMKDDDDKALQHHLVQELAAHLFLFIRGGLNSTTHAICSVLYELALHENVQQQVRDEVLHAVAHYGDNLNYECVQQFRYMGQVILESVRLHPVTPYLTRRTLSDYIVDANPKNLLKKGISVIIPIHAMHMDNANFPDAHTFDPERFSGQQTRSSRNDCLFLGFGEGPRNCIGRNLAELQIRVAIARLLMEYKFALYQPRNFVKSGEPVLLLVERIHHIEGGREAKIVI